MIIDGKSIASQILESLKAQVEKLKRKGIIPHLHIIIFSEDSSSASYVRQKILKGRLISAKITVVKKNPKINTVDLVKKIEKLNKDNSIHGIIVQRPMPKQLNEEDITLAVDPKKDVDGFHPQSRFGIPVVLAVLKILETVHETEFETWLKSQKIAVIGKGLTAGKPIANFLRKLGVQPLIIDSETKNKKELLKNSDIIISAVGKPDVFDSSEIKNGAVLIGVGLHKETDGKFHGDYNEEKIKNIAGFYTPTPGGVGPVNVTMLLKNLVESAEDNLTT